MFQSPTQQLNPAKLLPVLVSWIIISTIAFILVKKKKINSKLILTLTGASVVISGIIFGGIPNPVLPFQNIFTGITNQTPLNKILPMVIMLVVLVISTLFFGRVFCGYACPVGAIQELMSKLKFKSKLKEQKNVKGQIRLSRKYTDLIRVIFFVLGFIMTFIFGVALIDIVTPFKGYQIFTNSAALAITIPLIVLITTIVLGIFMYRPWCRLFCPFGLVASLTARLSLFKLKRTDACTSCGICEKICPTNEAAADSSKGECYLCNRCVDSCPQNAIVFVSGKK